MSAGYSAGKDATLAKFAAAREAAEQAGSTARTTSLEAPDESESLARLNTSENQMLNDYAVRGLQDSDRAITDDLARRRIQDYGRQILDEQAARRLGLGNNLGPSSPPMAGAAPMAQPQPSNFSWPGEMQGPIGATGETKLPNDPNGTLFSDEDREMWARGNKTWSVAKALNKAGLSSDELTQMSPTQLRSQLGGLSKSMGINQDGAYSDTSISQTLFYLRDLEKQSAASPGMIQKMRQAGVLGTAQELANSVK